MEKHIQMWRRTSLKVAMGAVLMNFAGTLPEAKAQAPAIEWQRSIGGVSQDISTCVRQTSDGGYIVGGVTMSNDGDVSGNHGSADAFIAKLDGTGLVQWKKCYGGSDDDGDNGVSIVQTSDGGYVFACQTSSNDGDVSVNNGMADGWIMKLDATGNIAWEKSFGTANDDRFNSVCQTSDGGFAVAGTSAGNYWILKLNASGSMVWQKSYGGSFFDNALAIRQTADGGYIVGGMTQSDDVDVSGNHGQEDFWILKLDGSGNKVWGKCLGGSLNDFFQSVEQTSDGGYVVCGSVRSADGDITVNKGGYDAWVVKLNGTGGIDWQKGFGSTKYETAMEVQQTSDGGYVVGATSSGNDGDVSGNHMADWKDYWILKLNSSGAIDWKKCYGGSSEEAAYSIRQTSDGGYIIAGSGLSVDGDVTGNHGQEDYWVVKLKGSASNVAEAKAAGHIEIYPNPNNGRFTVKTDAGAGLPVEIVVTDMLGQVIRRVSGKAGREVEVTIDAPSGVYLLSVENGADKFTEKIIIQ